MSRPPAPRRLAPADTLAAELALGVLEAEAHAAAEARAAVDPAFAAEAAAWSARLHPLSEEAAPIEPGPELWERIEAVLWPAALAPVPQPVAPEPSAPDTPAASGGAAEVVELAPRRQLRHWRRMAGLATGLAAACVVALVMVLARHPVAPAPLLTARLEPPAGVAVLVGAPLYTAVVDRGRRTVVLTAVGPGPVDPRARELWLIKKPGAPTPLGVIARDKPLRLPESASAAVDAGAVLAVSLEPPGGSPTGAPTGPVIATGVLARA